MNKGQSDFRSSDYIKAVNIVGRDYVSSHLDCIESYLHKCNKSNYRWLKIFFEYFANYE